MIITPQQGNSIPFKYAQDVLNGNIIVGKRIIQAVNRFYKWIDEADSKGFYLDHKKGMMKIHFFETLLTHTKGKSAGQPFILSPFQQFTIYNVFAWMQKTDNGPIRRINLVYEKEAKKNGKTATMAGLGLDHLSFELEQGAECYVGATKEEQAKICFNQACEFVKKSPVLQQLGFQVLQREIRFLPSSSSMKPLGGDSKTQDGINSSFSIIDEYHAHPNDGVKENLESSMASRKQPLVYIITTAGVNISGVCKNFEDSCVNVLDGLNEDDHALIMIHDLDEGDDWEDETVWCKANPNLGITVTLDFLRKEYNKARNQPSKIPNFKTKHLNMWVDAPEIWIPTEIWLKNKVGVRDYEGLFIEKSKKHGSVVAIDLSTTIDLTAQVWLTNPDESGNRYIMPYFFCPLTTVDRRSKEDRVPYRYWVDQGLIIATPGNRVDYEAIKKNTYKKYYKYNTSVATFDQWNAEDLRNQISETGITTSFFSQSIGVISYPTKQFEKLVYDEKLKHDGNLVLLWMLSGCVKIEDANENIKIHKGKSHKGKKRIDGIIATIMALGESLTPDDESDESQYNDPDKEITFGVG